MEVSSRKKKSPIWRVGLRRYHIELVPEIAIVYP